MALFLLPLSLLTACIALLGTVPLSAAETADLVTVKGKPDFTVALQNPRRGYVRDKGIFVVPAPTKRADNWQPFFWSDLETGEGQYDFSPIEAELARLKPGERLSFGVWPINSWSDARHPDGVFIPAYLARALTKSFYDPLQFSAHPIFVPDANSPLYIEAFRKLVAALGQKYDGDPRISHVELRVAGFWGEGHNGDSEKPIPYDNEQINKGHARRPSAATTQALIEAQIAAFPKTQLLAMTDTASSFPAATDGTNLLAWTLRHHTNRPIGLVRDSWGARHFQRDFLPNGISRADRVTILYRWQTAPVVVESEGANTIFQLGLTGPLDQIRYYHVSAIKNDNLGDWALKTADQKGALLEAGAAAGYRYSLAEMSFPARVTAGGSLPIQHSWLNAGNAPTYDRWRVVFSLISASTNTEAWSSRSALNLGTLLPAPQPSAQTDTFALPPGVAPGEYKLVVRVVDPEEGLRPMDLAIAGRVDGTPYYFLDGAVLTVEPAAGSTAIGSQGH